MKNASTATAVAAAAAAAAVTVVSERKSGGVGVLPVRKRRRVTVNGCPYSVSTERARLFAVGFAPPHVLKHYKAVSQHRWGSARRFVTAHPVIGEWPVASDTFFTACKRRKEPSGGERAYSATCRYVVLLVDNCRNQ